MANLVAMRDALIDEREKINLKNSPIDLHPPVVVEPKTRKWKPFIRNVSSNHFALVLDLFSSFLSTQGILQ